MNFRALFFGLLVLSGMRLSLADTPVTIEKIEFFGDETFSQIRVVGSKPFDGKVLTGATLDQLTIEIPNAVLANKNASRELVTANFSGKVKLITPYQVASQKIVKVVVQASEPFELKPKIVGSKLYLGVDQEADPQFIAVKRSSAAVNPNTLASAPKSAASTTPVTEEEALSIVNPDAVSRMDGFLEAQKTKNFKGKHITLQVKDADLIDVLTLIGETSGFNIVAGSDVSGKVTLSLIDVPWDLALDTILTTNKLGAERNQNILRIALLSNLAAEKLAEAQAKRAIESNAPRITKIFPISYARPDDLVKVLQKFGTGSGGGADGAGGAGMTSSSILVDERTNAIVIQETADNLARMGKMIELLDRPTPQILIEAKIVEASDSFGNTFSSVLGGGIPNPTQPVFGVNQGTAENGLFSSPLNRAEDEAIVGPAGGGAIGANMIVRPLGNLRLNALLSLTERESKSKILSSPRLTVLNRQTALISQGTPVLVPRVIVSQNGAAGSGEEMQQALLSLSVTPTVTNDGNVILDLNVTNDVPENSLIATRQMRSQVVTESGSTLAIGGIYSAREVDAESGIPFLRKIPILGALFGSKSKTKERRELFVFITPKILNEEVELPTEASAVANPSTASPATKL